MTTYPSILAYFLAASTMASAARVVTMLYGFVHTCIAEPPTGECVDAACQIQGVAANAMLQLKSNTNKQMAPQHLLSFARLGKGGKGGKGGQGEEEEEEEDCEEEEAVDAPCSEVPSLDCIEPTLESLTAWITAVKACKDYLSSELGWSTTDGTEECGEVGQLCEINWANDVGYMDGVSLEVDGNCACWSILNDNHTASCYVAPLFGTTC